MVYPCAAQRREKVTYRFLPHTADIRAAIDADTYAALLGQVVALLRELTGGSAVRAHPAREYPLVVHGDDPSDLLVRFAREVLAAFQLDAVVPAHLELDTLNLPPDGAPSLTGRLVGEPFDPSRHTTQPEIKAITRHGLRVLQDESGWHAEVLIDV
jgi:SHS2 domain-containing protein